MKVAMFTSLLCALLLTCNPMSEQISDAPCSDIHNKKINGVCHGENRRNPETSCSDAQCHGSFLTGGSTGGLSCYACHGEYWTVYTSHSLNIFGFRHWKDMCASTNFVTDCGDKYCHTASLGGSSSYMKSPGCGKCHDNPGYPANYADGTNCEISTTHTSVKNGARHHTDVCGNLNTCNTTDCHGSDYHGGTTGPFPGKSCLRCHAGSATNINMCGIEGTHTTNRDGVPHRSGSDTICATTDCHGTNLRGGTTGPIPGRSCSRNGCHD